jgi:SAM-dependent methyltransferase
LLIYNSKSPVNALKRDFLRILRCSDCSSGLRLEGERESGGEIEQGSLVCTRCAHTFPIVRFIPRFAPPENYSSSFGFQWQRFRTTQLDSHTGVPVSRTRFFAESNWRPEALKGALVLDAGCGAGRFAEVALDAGATLVALDYSQAVDACWSNFRFHPRLHLVQGDIYRLPFAPGTFEFVYSFGVLQHTPDVERAFQSLVPQLKPGGRIAVDLYPATPLNYFWPKYWLRPLTKRVAPERLYRIVQKMVPMLLPASLALGRVPRAGRKLRHVIPVVNYEGIFPLSPQQIREWAVLDTFDMLAPAHDRPQSARTLKQWFAAAALEDVEVHRPGLVVGRGRKPPASEISRAPAPPRTPLSF